LVSPRMKGTSASTTATDPIVTAAVVAGELPVAGDGRRPSDEVDVEPQPATTMSRIAAPTARDREPAM
jgi:hypothetical protein